MRVLPLIAALALAACARGPDRKLETRLSALEAAQAKSDFELRAALARLDKTVETLAGSVGAAGDDGERIDRLLEQLGDLQARLRDLEAARGQPPARPSFR